MVLEDKLKSGFKLNLYETRVYLSLLEGRLAPKEIASASRVPMSRVYDTLKSLEKKGFVEHLDDSYVPVPPDIALQGRVAQFRAEFEEESKERERTEKDILDELNSLAKIEKVVPELLVLKGIYSIAGKFMEVLKESDDIFITVRHGLEAGAVFTSYLESVDSMPRRIRVLLSEEVELTDEYLELGNSLGIEIRRCHSIIFDMMVADGRDVMIGVPDPTSSEAYHAIAVFMRNPQFAKGITESLETFWKQCS